MEIKGMPSAQQNSLRGRKNPEEDLALHGFDQVLADLSFGMIPGEVVTESLGWIEEANDTSMDTQTLNPPIKNQPTSEMDQVLGGIGEELNPESLSVEDKARQVLQQERWQEASRVLELDQTLTKPKETKEASSIMGKVESNLNKEIGERCYWQGREKFSLFQAREGWRPETERLEEGVPGLDKAAGKVKEGKSAIDGSTLGGASLNLFQTAEPVSSPIEDIVTEKELLPQVAQGIAKALKETESGFTLRLKPAELGEITLAFEREEGGMVLKMSASSPETAQRMNQHLEELREVLKPYGMQIQPVIHQPKESVHWTAEEGGGLLFQNGEPEGQSSSRTFHPFNQGRHGRLWTEETADPSLAEITSRPGRMERYA